MLTLQKAKEVSYNIATFGKFGKSTLGMFLASLLAFPILFVDRIFYNIWPSLSYWFLGLVFVSSALIILLALNLISDEYPSNIVLNKVIGMMITFAFIPLKLKLMLFGFIFFHIINFLRPFLFNKTIGEKISNLPFGLGILVGDIITGVFCNIFLQIIVWVVQ